MSRAQPPEDLSHFLASELVVALGRLAAPQVLGPWPGHRPAERRAPARGPADLYTPVHAHEHPEICHLLAGACTLADEERRCRLRPGDLVFLPAGRRHAEGWLRRDTAYTMTWWILDPADPCVQATRYRTRGGYEIVHRVPLLPAAAESRARLALLRECAAGSEPPPLDRLREALLTLTLDVLRRAAAAPDPAALDARAEVVRRAAEFVRDAADRPLRVEDVSRAVRLSPNYLTGLFRRHTGRPLGRFIAEERIARARELLARTSLPVKAVADRLGFPDGFAFSRAFKRVAGLSPAAWRLRRGGEKAMPR